MLTPHHVEELKNPSELVASLLESGITVAFEARGTSMLPAIRPGDKLFVEPIVSLEPGQVVLMKLARGLTAHRIVRLAPVADSSTLVVTRGDNSPDDDPPADSTQLLGRVVYVTRDGRELPVERRSRLRLGLWRLVSRLRALWR